MKRELKIEIAIHVACWVLVLCIPFVFVEYSADGLSFNWNRYVRHCAVIGACAVVVYTNYFYLLPHLLFEQKRTILFWLVNVFIIFALAFCLAFSFHPDKRHPRAQTAVSEMKAEDRPADSPHHYRRPPTYLPPQAIFFLRDFMFLCLAFGISYAVKLVLRFRRKELHYQHMERMQLETELQQLRYQVNPHFLLNTLNNIYALTAIDASKAQTSILELSKMLRYALYDNEKYVSLAHEVHFLRNYIDLMRLRLNNDITVTTDFDVDDDTPTRIAPMLFISLVENAFKHGIPPQGKCTIFIALHEDVAGRVTCRVANGNYPKTDTDKSGSGIGLAQLRRRLELIYPDRYEWDVHLSADRKEYISELTINTKA